MIRIVIDIEEYGNTQGTREIVAMALEHIGDVRIVAIHTNKETKGKKL